MELHVDDLEEGDEDDVALEMGIGRLAISEELSKSSSSGCENVQLSSLTRHGLSCQTCRVS